MEQPPGTPWVLLVYKIPREPTASRAQVWRKLKRLGALLLHDAVWVLPATPWTREQFQWLTVEIGELGGEAYLWEDRKSTRLNSSHLVISYAVFCLKKKIMLIATTIVTRMTNVLSSWQFRDAPPTSSRTIAICSPLRINILTSPVAFDKVCRQFAC